MPKLNVLILFGGQSAEHEVSIMSARNVANALDPDKYVTTVVGIDKQGQWHQLPDPKLLKDTTFSIQSLPVNLSNNSNLVPSAIDFPVINSSLPIDVVFPVLHGPNGEDGTVQGLLKLTGLPFVGSGVLGSAVNMDKDVAKRLLRDAAIPIADFLVFHNYQQSQIDFKSVTDQLGLPLFVKPANLGSSIGVSKVHDKTEFDLAITAAFNYDKKIIIEKSIVGREIECSVLGNDQPIASVPGEIKSTHEFYDYDAKYIDENGASLEIPANLTSEQISQIQTHAIRAYQILECEGLGRVDMFLTPDDQVLINEINTIPGFTNISMYPKLWEASGLSYSQLIDRLIELAIERSNQEKKLLTTK